MSTLPPSSSQYGDVLAYTLYTFTLIFSLFSFILYLLRLTKPWCNCEICKAYINSTWTSNFINLSDWYTHLLKSSPTNTIHIHVLNNIVTSNPNNVEHMLKTNFDNYQKGQPFRAILSDLLGNGIFNVDGVEWRFQRKMASLELGSVAIRSYAFEVVGSEIRTKLVPILSNSVQNGVVLDMQDVFKRFSFDNICRFSFGIDPGCLRMSMPESVFATAFDLATRLSAQRALSTCSLIWKVKRLFDLGSEKELRKAIMVVDTLAKEVINQKRSFVGFSSQNDLLTRCMSSVNDGRYRRDVVVSFMLAGRDTIASVLTAFFHLIQNNLDVVKKIQIESDRIIGKSNATLATFEQLREMHYLQASIYETMRLLPPVQFDSKYAQNDDVLPDGTFITKGTRVTYHPYAMGRMESIWGSDWAQFKPDRWLRNDGVFKQTDAFKYPVFQAGLRVCLGKELAIMITKSVVLALVRRFDIKAVEPCRRPVFVPGLTASFHGGLPVTISNRI